MSYHQLMLENHTVFTKMVFDGLEDKDLSLGQPKILEYLHTHNGAIQRDIADACQIEPATATSLLSRMEKNGLIERKRRDGDRRYTCVYLTDLGEKDGKDVVKVMNDTESKALKGFSDEETKTFIDFLTRVNDNLTA